MKRIRNSEWGNRKQQTHRPRKETPALGGSRGFSRITPDFASYLPSIKSTAHDRRFVWYNFR